MERRALALWFTGTGLVVGIAGNILLYRQLWGISFLLFTIICLAAVFMSARVGKIRVNPRNLWLVAPILFFAAMVALRENSFMLWVNLMATTGLGLLLLHYITASDPLDTATLPGMTGAATSASIRSIVDTPAEIGDAWRHVRETSLQQRQGVVAVGRGLLLTLPVLLVFVVLLASADQVFEQYTNQFFSLLAIDDFEALIERGFVTVMLGWVAIGGLSYGLARRLHVIQRKPTLIMANPPETDDAASTTPDEPVKRKNTPIQLTIIEATMMLGSVNLLFLAFVVIQFTYLFGGSANITAAGFTYAEYARRGFWELEAVTILALALGLGLDWVTIRRGTREQNLFRGLAVILSALMGVLIVSASQRMTLYEQVYGFTDDRVFVHLFIFWFGLLFPTFLLHLFKAKQNVFAFAVLLVTIGYTGHLNLLNVDLYIAEHNIARYHETGDLDICYLNTLSVDALPAILKLREDVRDSNPFLHTQLNTDLYYDWLRLDHQRDEVTLLGYNAPREYAWSTLSAMDEVVSPSDYVGCYEAESRLDETIRP